MDTSRKTLKYYGRIGVKNVYYNIYLVRKRDWLGTVPGDIPCNLRRTDCFYVLTNVPHAYSRFLVQPSRWFLHRI